MSAASSPFRRAVPSPATAAAASADTGAGPSAPATVPAPSLFDILPPLYALLCRLLPPDPGSSSTNLNPTTGSAGLATGHQHPPQHHYPHLHHPHHLHHAHDGPPLEPPQLAVEASAIKLKLHRARAAVEALPDMERSVEEQEAEMAALAARIRQQRRMLAQLARTARDVARQCAAVGDKGAEEGEYEDGEGRGGDGANSTAERKAEKEEISGGEGLQQS